MYAKLLLFLFLALAGSSAAAAGPARAAPFPLSAKSEAELQQRFDLDHHGVVAMRRIEVPGKSLLLLTQDAGFGTTRQNIFVYLLTENEWQLLAFRRTNSSTVEVDTRRQADAITLLSTAGKVLMVLPYESISLNWDPKEQR